MKFQKTTAQSMNNASPMNLYLRIMESSLGESSKLMITFLSNITLQAGWIPSNLLNAFKHLIPLRSRNERNPRIFLSTML